MDKVISYPGGQEVAPTAYDIPDYANQSATQVTETPTVGTVQVVNQNNGLTIFQAAMIGAMQAFIGSKKDLGSDAELAYRCGQLAAALVKEAAKYGAA